MSTDDAQTDEDRTQYPHDKLMKAGTTEPPDRRISLLLLVATVFLLGRAGGWSLLIVVLAIIIMIFLHELGHYLTAKWSGMKVTEFFFGFGPKLWSFTRGETEYGVKAIPAGAYVRIIGMNNLEEVPLEEEPKTYRAQSYPKRLLVATAGSGMHFIQALLCLFLMLTLTGGPGGHVFLEDNTIWQINEVLDGSPAQQAGLQSGDRVVAIDGDPVKEFTDLREKVVTRPGEQVTLQVKRGGQTLTVTTTLANESGQGKLGVSSGLPPRQKVGVLAAIPRTFEEFGTGTRLSLQALGSFFSPSGLSNFASDVVNGGSPTVDSGQGGQPGNEQPSADKDRPVSIVGAARIGSDLTEEGLYGFLAFFMTINMFVGIVNLVPLLPLDGGHVAIATYERIRSRKGRRYQVDVVKLLPLTYAVVTLLALLFISTIFLDLVDPITVN